MRGKVATAEVDVDAAPGRVWQALTDTAEVKEWMAGTTLKADLAGRESDHVER